MGDADAILAETPAGMTRLLFRFLPDNSVTIDDNEFSSSFSDMDDYNPVLNGHLTREQFQNQALRIHLIVRKSLISKGAIYFLMFILICLSIISVVVVVNNSYVKGSSMLVATHGASLALRNRTNSNKKKMIQAMELLLLEMNKEYAYAGVFWSLLSFQERSSFDIYLCLDVPKRRNEPLAYPAATFYPTQIQGTNPTPDMQYTLYPPTAPSYYPPPPNYTQSQVTYNQAPLANNGPDNNLNQYTTSNQMQGNNDAGDVELVSVPHAVYDSTAHIVTFPEV